MCVHFFLTNPVADKTHSGEHAGVKWINGTCLACDFCQQADEPLCSKALLSGYTVDGSFQQYCIAKAAHVARLHKDIPLDAVAPVLCGKQAASKNESYTLTPLQLVSPSTRA